jgi:uncharacterized delta-60 repeat protein
MNNHLLSLVSRLQALAIFVVLLEAMSASAQPLPRLDAAFHPVITRAGGYVSAIVAQADGKLVIAGRFNAIAGVARNGIARLHRDGTVDPTFDPGAGVCCGSPGGGGREPTAPISTMLLQRDGRIVIGGPFSTVNGVARRVVARLNGDGSLDTGFAPEISLGGDTIMGLPPVLPVLYAGTAVGQASTARGMNDPASVALLGEQADGKLIVGGYFTSVNGVPRKGVARLNANGSLDTTFDPGSGLSGNDAIWGVGRLNTLVRTAGGQFLVAGAFSTFNDTPRNSLARLDANGSLDPALNVGIQGRDAAVSIDGMAAQADGKIIFSGSFTAVEGKVCNGLARIDAAGRPDPAFAPVINENNRESYRVLGGEADGKWIARRRFADASGIFQHEIVRLDESGAPDPAFRVAVERGLPEWFLLEGGNGFEERIHGIVQQPDGKWVVVGKISAGAEGNRFGILRIHADGGIDGAFHPKLELAEDLASNVQSLAAQKDGKILIGGVFNRVNGVGRNLLARLNRDGSLDDSFAPVIHADDPYGSVSAITVRPDGGIWIGGLFHSVNGIRRSGIARLKGDGSLDTAFDPGAGTAERNASGGDVVGRVSVIAARSDGKILIAGNFNRIHDIVAPWLALLNPDGSVDGSFSHRMEKVCPDCPPPDIRDIAVLSDNRILLCGSFARMDGVEVNGLARLQADGSLDRSFQPPATSGELFVGIAAFPDDRVVVLSQEPAGGFACGRIRYFKKDGTYSSEFRTCNVDVIFDRAPFPPGLISTFAIDADERIVLAGTFSRIARSPRSGLARITVAEKLDLGFDAGAGFSHGALDSASDANSMVARMVLQEDGGIVVAGAFGAVGDQARLGLARFQAEPPSPRSGGGNGKLHSLARSADGTYYMSVSGDAGRVYHVEASDDLESWSELGTVTGAKVAERFRDPGAKPHPTRFYRLRGE